MWVTNKTFILTMACGKAFKEAMGGKKSKKKKSKTIIQGYTYAVAHLHPGCPLTQLPYFKSRHPFIWSGSTLNVSGVNQRPSFHITPEWIMTHSIQAHQESTIRGKLAAII